MLSAHNSGTGRGRWTAIPGLSDWRTCTLKSAALAPPRGVCLVGLLPDSTQGYVWRGAPAHLPQGMWDWVGIHKRICSWVVLPPGSTQKWRSGTLQGCTQIECHDRKKPQSVASHALHSTYATALSHSPGVDEGRAYVNQHIACKMTGVQLQYSARQESVLAVFLVFSFSANELLQKMDILERSIFQDPDAMNTNIMYGNVIISGTICFSFQVLL